jgi:hypothetical protein
MRFTKFYIILIAAICALSAAADSSYSPRVRSGKHRIRDSCPGQYTFGIPNINVVNHRSASEDTIYVAAAVSVESGGTITIYNITECYGQHGNGILNTGILFSNIPIGDNDVAIFSYLVVNAGHGSQQDVEQMIGDAVIAVVKKGAQIATGVLIGDLLPTLGRIIGFALNNIVGWIVSFIGNGIEELVSQGCDGYLAAGLHAFSGEQICESTSIMGTDACEGAPDEELLGLIPGVVCSTTTSLYEVDWFVQ